MTAFGQAIGAHAVATGAYYLLQSVNTNLFNRLLEYPWHDLPAESSVCDVGSGVGTVTLELAKTYPHMKLILQDMPSVLKYAQEVVWPAEFPQALENAKVEFKPIDFFTESPESGCDVYFVSFRLRT